MNEIDCRVEYEKSGEFKAVNTGNGLWLRREGNESELAVGRSLRRSQGRPFPSNLILTVLPYRSHSFPRNNIIWMQSIGIGEPNQ